MAQEVPTRVPLSFAAHGPLREPGAEPVGEVPDGLAGGTLRAEGAGLTHRGCVRARNEDAILTDPTGLLWAVSDGMGGHGHGDVASDIVVDCLASIADARARTEGEAALVAEIGRANALVRARAVALGGGTMGATVVAAVVHGGEARLAWVGDSRAYHGRGGRVRQVSRDHTLVQEMVEAGSLSPEAAAHHPQGHVITRAVGAEDAVEVEALRLPLLAGDWLLLCSDGLSGCLSEARLAGALAEAASPAEACHRLLTEALAEGAPDNVSVIAVRMG